MITATFAVSLEHDTLPIRTNRGLATAPSPASAARKALAATLKAFKGVRWRSCVVVLEKVEKAAHS